MHTARRGEEVGCLIMVTTGMIKLNVMIFNFACSNDDDDDDNDDIIDKTLKTMWMTVTLLMFLDQFIRGRDNIVIRYLIHKKFCTIAMKNCMKVKMLRVMKNYGTIAEFYKNCQTLKINKCKCFHLSRLYHL